MSQWIVVLVASIGATAVTLPLVRVVLLRQGVLDHASERSSHTAATPRGGGLGVLTGVAAGALAALLSQQLDYSRGALAVGSAVLLLALTGFRDDLRSIHPVPRLLVQCVMGLWVGLALSTDERLSVLAVASLAGIALMVFVVNVVNFMDGINGITALTVMAWGATALWAGLRSDVSLAMMTGTIAFGTGLAFLPFNTPRAHLFLGDVGSYLYGALIASASMVMLTGGVPPLVVIAPLVPYSADVSATLFRRARRGASLSEAHREHLYQHLTGPAGDRHFRVALAYGGVAFACGVAALLAPTVPATLLLLFVAAVIAIGPKFVTSYSPNKGKN